MKKSLGVLLLISLCSVTIGMQGTAAASEYRRITFPVVGPVSYSDDFGQPRSGGRTHEGNDLMGFKLQKLISAVDGRVSFMRIDSEGTSGNMMTVTDLEGWSYRYIHINNDTPGTDDGLNPLEWAFATGIAVGTKVAAGQHVAYLGDSGNAEGTAPHLHFEIRRPDGSPINPWTSLRLSQGLRAGDICAYDSNPAGVASTSSARGYYVLGSDGGVFAFGHVGFYGSTGAMSLRGPVVGMGITRSGDGYWLLGSDGGIFSFGDAEFHGSTGGMILNRPVVAIAPTPSGNGYWLAASDGGIFAFGDAGFFGSTGGMRLRQPIVGIAPTKTGNGYWLVAADGGVFSFGDAGFYGSTGGMALARPIISMSITAGGDGYWMLGADGGIFAFGDAGYYGSIPGLGRCTWSDAAGMAVTTSGRGYWLVDRGGAVFGFGDARYLGALNSLGLPRFAPPIGIYSVKP